MNEAQCGAAAGRDEGHDVLLDDCFGPGFGVDQVMPVPDVEQDQRRLRQWDLPVEMGVAGVGFDPLNAGVDVPAVVAGFYVQ